MSLLSVRARVTSSLRAVALSNPKSSTPLDKLEALEDRLFKGYRKDLPPLLDDRAVEVKTGLDIQKLVGLNQLEGTLTMIVWFRLQWKDFRLAYDAADLGMKGWNSTSDFLSIDLSQLWYPDIALLNAASAIQYMDQSSYAARVEWYDRARLEDEGFNMILVRPAIITSRCAVNMETFPFDTQRCDVRWGSWSTLTRFMNLAAMEQEIADVADGNEEYQVLHINATSLQHAYDAYPADASINSSRAEFPETIYQVTLRRFSTWYVMVIILPLLCILLFSNFVFFIDIRGGKRHSVCVTLVLTVMASRLLIAERLPASHDNMWMNTFQTRILQYILACSVETVISNYVDHWGDRHGFNGEVIDLLMQFAYPVGILYFMVSNFSEVDISTHLSIDLHNPGAIIMSCACLFIMHLVAWGMAIHNLTTFTTSPQHAKYIKDNPGHFAVRVIDRLTGDAGDSSLT